MRREEGVGTLWNENGGWYRKEGVYVFQGNAEKLVIR